MRSQEFLESLAKRIQEAEHHHMAAGLLVEVCRDALADAIHAQNETRRTLMALRRIEAEDSEVLQ